MASTSLDLHQTYFRLFDLPQSYALDSATLEQRYRALQMTVHPDKSAHLSAAEQRIAMQQATFVNEGYQTLRSTLRRSRYLLQLNGVDTQEETNTAMPMAFLMAQLEWREAVLEAQHARDVDALEALEARMHVETAELEAQLADKIDAEKNYAAAAVTVRKLRFMEKLAEEIGAAYDAVDI